MPIELPEVMKRPTPEPDAHWIQLMNLIQKIDFALNDSSYGDNHGEKHGEKGRIVSLDPQSLGSHLSDITVRDILQRKDNHNDEVNRNNKDDVKREMRGLDSRKMHKENDDDDSLGDRVDVEHYTLPSFSSDYSEMFLAGMIERTSDSWDLHVTTFLVCHTMLEGDATGRSAHNVRNDRETLLSWSKAVVAFRKVIYTESGVRDGPKFYCKISHSDWEASYVVEG